MNQSNFEDFDIEIVESSPEIEIVESTMVVEDNYPTIEVSEDESFSPIEYTEWETPADFTNYIVSSVRKAPELHKGSKNSLRRVFAFFEKLSEEMIQGVEQDAAYAELSEDQLRTFDVIEEGIETALRDISAAINGNERIKKTATKSSAFKTYINPFIFGLARVLINGKVSQGKNIEALYQTLNGKYKLNDREQLELHFALEDMGYPMSASFVDGVDRAETYYA